MNLKSESPAGGAVAAQPSDMPMQTVMADEGQIGNCFQAALAGVLGLKIESVPHFPLLGMTHWMQCCIAWLEKEKGVLVDTSPDEYAADGYEVLPRHIINGQTVRGTAHAVVGDTATGEMIHDPHPSGAGLSFVNSRFYLYRKAAPQSISPPPTAPTAMKPLQVGLSNEELREAWNAKLPGVEPQGRDLTAFALGVEVGLALDGEAPYAPDKCPITGRKFWGNIEHPYLGLIATYGGPFDTYTIPHLEDGELRCERFDQDADHWVEGGEPLDFHVFTEAEFAELNSRAAAVPAHPSGQQAPAAVPSVEAEKTKAWGLNLLANAKEAAIKETARRAWDAFYFKCAPDISLETWTLIWRKAVMSWTTPVSEASAASVSQAVPPTPSEPQSWLPIETAPKGRKVLAGYFNKRGNWRTVTACYYLPQTLQMADDRDDLDDDGYAPEGWYEESGSQENILPTDEPPTHWMPLPKPPAASQRQQAQPTGETK